MLLTKKIIKFDKMQTSNKTKEQFMKKLNNDEVKKIIENHIEESKRRNSIINELISNTDYIDWIYEYTEKNGGFTDQTRIRNNPKIPKEEQENIDKLLYFFEGITEYANENYLYPNNDNGIYYTIIYNNISYEIGVIVGQGTVCFCTRSTKKDNAIDFNDILKKNKPERTEIINNKLIELQNYLDSLINKDIPVEALTETTQKVLQKVKK